MTWMLILITTACNGQCYDSIHTKYNYPTEEVCRQAGKKELRQHGSQYLCVEKVRGATRGN